MSEVLRKTPDDQSTGEVIIPPTLRERWSIALSCALINVAIWQIGVFFNSFGGRIDAIGATLCIATWSVAPFLIIGSTIYSPIRRFLLSNQTWDLYGPVCAIASYMVMHWQLQFGHRS